MKKNNYLISGCILGKQYFNGGGGLQGPSKIFRRGLENLLQPSSCGKKTAKVCIKVVVCIQKHFNFMAAYWNRNEEGGLTKGGPGWYRMGD